MGTKLYAAKDPAGAVPAWGGAPLEAELGWTSGDQWILAGQATGSTGLLVQGRENAVPFYLPVSTSISKLALDVSTVGSAGALVRLGIRSHNPKTGWPGGVLLDAGTIDGTVSGVSSITLGSALVLAAGWYWCTATGQGAPTTQATIRTAGASSVLFPCPLKLPSSGGFAALSLLSMLGFYQGSVTGALPATFTPISGTGAVPRMLAQAT